MEFTFIIKKIIFIANHINESKQISSTRPQVNNSIINLVHKINISAKDYLSYINILDAARLNEEIDFLEK